MEEKIAVYGAGKIGAGEATLISGNGFETVVIGHSEKGILRCKEEMAQNWGDLIAQNLATEKNKSAALRLVNVTKDVSQMKNCTFVLEAVSEDLEIKKSVFSNIEKYCGDDTIIASCTSSIDAGVLAGFLKHPNRLIIAHPFQPAHMLPLVEVVRHEKVSDDTVQRTVSLLEKLKRQVVILKKVFRDFL